LDSKSLTFSKRKRLAIGRSVGEGHQSLVRERWSTWLSDFLYERWRGCAYWMKCWQSDSRRDPSKHYESSIHHCSLSALPKIQCGLGNQNKVLWRIKRYYLYALITWPLRRRPITHSLPLFPVLRAQTKALCGAEHFTKALQRYYWNRLFYSHPFRLIIPQTNRTPTTSTFPSSTFLFFAPAVLQGHEGLWRCLLG